MDYQWAMVELHRWQDGELPMGPHQNELNVPKALHNGAMMMSTKECPDPFNVASVLHTVADWWKDLEDMINVTRAILDNADKLEAQDVINKAGKAIRKWRTDIPAFDPDQERSGDE